MVMCPLVCLAGRATHGSCRRFGLLGLRVSTKLAALWLFWLFRSSLLLSASSSLLLDELLLLLCKRTAEFVVAATVGCRPARTQPLLLDCEKPLTRRENAEILMPPSPVAETATDLTDDTVASSTASAATSKQGLGSAELATTTRKHKKCEGKPIKAGHTPQTGVGTTTVWAGSVTHETMEHCHAVLYRTTKNGQNVSQPAPTDL
jgi:hypothetical protein